MDFFIEGYLCSFTPILAYKLILKEVGGVMNVLKDAFQ
jgi:hypothetical protein